MSSNITFLKKTLRSRWLHIGGVVLIVSILFLISRPAKLKPVDVKKFSVEQLQTYSVSHPSIEIDGELMQRKLASGKYQESLELARKLVRQYPRDARAHNALGVAYASISDLASARQAFQNAILLDSKRVDPYVNLGKLALAFGENQRAVSEFDRATTVDPKSASAWTGMAEANVELHNMQDAVDQFQKAIKLAPNRTEAYTNLGNFLSEMGRDEEARPNLQRSLELGDKSEKLYAGLAMVYADQPKSDSELKEALDYANKAKKIEPSDGMVDFARGLALQKLGRYAEAIESYKQNIRVSTNASGAWVGISQCYRVQGKIALADQAAKIGEAVLNHRQRVGNLRHQLESNPNQLSLREQYADIMLADHQYSMAADQYRYVAMHTPDQPSKWLKVAKAFDLAGNKELADYVRPFATKKPSHDQKTAQSPYTQPGKMQ